MNIKVIIYSYFNSFSFSSQTSIIWRMLWFALSWSAPMLSWMYSFRKSSANFLTSFGQVALHIRVCLSGLSYKLNNHLHDRYKKKKSIKEKPFNNFSTKCFLKILLWFVLQFFWSEVQIPCLTSYLPRPVQDKCTFWGLFFLPPENQSVSQVLQCRFQHLLKYKTSVNICSYKTYQ